MTNHVALHTTSGVVIQEGPETGSLDTLNCDVNAPGQPDNAGCGGRCALNTTYGHAFNTAGGGVYAMDWTADAIRIWHFTQKKTPQDILNGTPNPSGWGKVSAYVV